MTLTHFENPPKSKCAQATRALKRSDLSRPGGLAQAPRQADKIALDPRGGARLTEAPRCSNVFDVLRHFQTFTILCLFKRFLAFRNFQ